MTVQFMIAALGQKRSKILYNNNFSCRNYQEDEETPENDDERTKDSTYSETTYALLNRVKVELQIGHMSPLGNIQSLVDPYSLNSNEFGGIFSWSEADDTPKTVVWHMVQNLNQCFVMVCDWRENRIAVFRTMKQIIRCVLERLENTQLMKKIYVVSVIIDVLLPNGQLILTTQPVMAHLLKKIDTILKNA